MQPMSLPLPNSLSGTLAPKVAAQEFSEEEHAQLLRLAHDSIVSAFDRRDLPIDAPTPRFAELRGAFTSIYLHSQLRGCVGYVLPTFSLYRTVTETARAAAFNDTRFQSITKDEAPNLEIELSILSAPQPIQPEAIEIGRHGLIVGQHGHRGLLLPQVPIEHHWDRITFLEQTCRKAGLPSDAWQKGASLQAFTAEVFGDKAE
jgi:AmmeMemoRadiSam system protein A